MERPASPDRRPTNVLNNADTSYTVPYYEDMIPQGAFRNCAGITSITVTSHEVHRI